MYFAGGTRHKTHIKEAMVKTKESHRPAHGAIDLEQTLVETGPVDAVIGPPSEEYQA